MLKAVEQKLEEANKLIFVKRYGEAEQVLDQLLETPEASAEMIVHLRRVELAAMLKKLDKARTHYHTLLKKGAKPATVEICLAFVDLHGDTAMPTEATSTFQDIIRQHGPSAAAYYGIGYAMEQQGNHERAIFSYQQALGLDPHWTPAYFGLSQIYYQMGDEKQGDHFFFLFEQAAPHNVYGNFETHRRLCQEFLQRERFLEAEAAIQALSEWWIENKGSCPAEIQIYELLATARIAEAQGDRSQAETRKLRANALALGVLEDPKTTEGVLYFVAKVLEEFDDFSKALKYYKRILKGEGGSPAMVQKIGSQFLSLGEFRLAKELFEEAYQSHPENPDIRFCLLVSNLKLANVNVEEYLIGRERLRQLTDGGDRVELLALLHSLLAKFTGDSDVQGAIADVYLRLGNVDRAGRHYDTMYQIDGLSRSTALKYAAFAMQHREPDKAMEILSRISTDDGLPSDLTAEVYWLKASFYARKREYRESLALLRKVLALDPWNVSYLVQEVINLMHLAPIDDDLRKADKVLATLGGVDDAKLDWTEFDQLTHKIEAQHAYELAYARRKLRYLYANGSEDSLLDLVLSAGRHDAARGTYDFMKLLNTNFDSHNIYWALGTLFKELWQLETAGVWFEQMLLFPRIPKSARAKAYLELADCLVWRGQSGPKAIEYAKLAVDLDDRRDQRAMRVLAHAYLKSGQIRQAKIHLEHDGADLDNEARYLLGLLHYRNGARQTANEVWKPLLTVRSESLRFHNIKQEILKFYFEGSPYLKAN